MPDLIAIGYPDTTTAVKAMDEVGHLAQDLVIQPDAVAAVVRGEDGKFRTITNQHEVGAGATWGMFWGLLFGLLFFVPIFGMAFGAAFGALGGKLAKSSISKEFQEQVRDQMQPGGTRRDREVIRQPGTSALFMIVEQMTTDKALAGLSQFGGTVLKTSLSDEDQAEIQEALHGQGA